MMPEIGEWYLVVNCDTCNCTILLFHDLNHRQGNLNGEYRLRCPRCKITQTLPVNHYYHQEGKKPDIRIEIL